MTADERLSSGSALSEVAAERNLDSTQADNCPLGHRCESCGAESRSPARDHAQCAERDVLPDDVPEVRGQRPTAADYALHGGETGGRAHGAPAPPLDRAAHGCLARRRSAAPEPTPDRRAAAPWRRVWTAHRVQPETTPEPPPGPGTWALIGILLVAALFLLSARWQHGPLLRPVAHRASSTVHPDRRMTAAPVAAPAEAHPVAEREWDLRIVWLAERQRWWWNAWRRVDVHRAVRVRRLTRGCSPRDDDRHRGRAYAACVRCPDPALTYR